MYYDLYTIIGIFSLLVIFVLYVFTKVPHRYVLKFIMIPFIIALAFVGIVKIETLLGRPYNSVPQTEFSFIDFQIKKDSVSKIWIEIWIVDSDNNSRLYVWPYSEKLHEQLQQAKQQAGKTGDRLFFKAKKNQQNNQDSIELENTKRIPKKDLLPQKQLE